MTQKQMKSVLALVTGAALTSVAHGEDGWGRFSLSYRSSFNISAEFSGVGGFSASGNPGGPGSIAGAAGTVVRQYDDGFIGIDISGNAGNLTWYWGYNEGSQVVGDMVRMNSFSSPGIKSGEVDDGPQHGMELGYQIPVTRVENWKIGIESAFGWTDIGITDSRAMAGTIITSTHGFALNGVIPPVAPYAGTVGGPGAMISDVAVDLGSTLGTAVVTGTRTIDAALYSIRLGPYFEWELAEHASLQLSGGLSLGWMDSTFSYYETIVTGGVNRTAAGRGGKSDWLIGAYARGQVNVNVSEGIWLFGGVEFNHLGDFEQTVMGRKATVDFGAVVAVSGGLSISF